MLASNDPLIVKVNSDSFPLTHSFSEGVYIREMSMLEGGIVIGKIHNKSHTWFLMKGKIIVTTNGEDVEHIAPCYEKSLKGAKRLIRSLEDSVFINVHKNPTNTEDMEQVEESLYSITIEEYTKKEKLWQE